MFARSPFRVPTRHAILACTRRIVAVAALSSCASLAAPAAAPAPAEPSRPAAEPTALAAELNAELQLVYRDNVPEYTQRSEQVRRAVEAWNASSKSAAERNQIIAWLRESIRLSMPGSTKPLPPLPAPVRDPVSPAREIAPAVSASKSVLTAKPVSIESHAAAESRATPELKRTPEPPTATPASGASEDNPFRDDPEFPSPIGESSQTGGQK
jgi:hypothetical protein